MGELAFQSEDLGQAKCIVAAVLGAFLELLPPRNALWTRRMDSATYCLFFWAVHWKAYEKTNLGIRAWRQDVAEKVVRDLEAAASGDQSNVDWTLVRSQMAAVVGRSPIIRPWRTKPDSSSRGSWSTAGGVSFHDGAAGSPA